jgi:hypothetical protein
LAVTLRHNGYLLAATVLAALLYALLSREPIGTGLICFGLLVSMFPLRGKLDPIGQIILAAFCAVVTYLITMILGESGETNPARNMNNFGTMLAQWLLFVAITRRFLKIPRGGIPGDAGILFLAVLSMGGVSRGFLYPGLALCVLVLLVPALRAADPGRPKWIDTSPKEKRATAVILGGALAIAVSLMISLPVLFHWGFNRWLERSLAPHIGFSRNLSLGSLRDVLQSDTVILRIRGQKPDYLRGFVYSRYLNRIWLADETAAAENEVTDISTIPAKRETKFTRDTGITAVGGEFDRYFVPLNASNIRIDRESARVAPGGILLPPDGHDARTIHFDMNSTGNWGIRKAHEPPTPALLDVHEALEPYLRKIARDWTQDTVSKLDKLRAIEARLHEGYRYSLEFERSKKGDPLLVFLISDKQGHCEYFASAMALLARTLGIHTRVVAGYRVTERNNIGGYYVVRERHAHTWVEAWTEDDGWQTFEPTPTDALLATYEPVSPFFPALADAVSELLRSLGVRIAAFSLRDILVIVGILILIWVIMVVIRRIKEQASVDLKDMYAYSAPPEAMSRLIQTLEAAGRTRAASEPVDQFIVEVASAPGFEQRRPRLLQLVREYNAWRFGGVGDLKSISRGIEEWIDMPLPFDG